MPFTLRDEEWEEMIYEFENQYNPHGLLGIYLEPNLPQRFKVDIAEYLQRRNPDLWEEFQQQKPEVMDEARKWEQRWTRRSMDRHAQPLGGETPPEPEEGGIKINALDPIAARTYFTHARTGGLRDAMALELLIMSHTAAENQTREYTNQVIALVRGFGFSPTINVTLENWLRARELRGGEGGLTQAPAEEEPAAPAPAAEEPEPIPPASEGETLEQQLSKAIAEERYEDADELQKKIDRLKRILGPQGAFNGTLCLGDKE